jgi:hypothetical protein
MAYNVKNCVSTLGNTGLSQCLDNLGYDAMLIWTTEDFEFANEAAAILEANWESAINAGTMFPFPIFDAVEPAIEDNVKQDLPTGVSLFVREGKYGGKGMMQVALCNLAALRTFNEVQGRAFIVTGDGQVFGTSPDAAKFKGFKLSDFHVSMLKGTDGSTKRMVELEYQFKNTTEMADYPAVPELTWDPLTLTGVKDVTVAVSGTPSSTELIVSVTGNCDGVAVTGLVAGDFTVLDSASNTETPDSVTDNGDGTYTFDYTGTPLTADTYTVNLKAPASQTTGGYESATAASFTIT